MQTLYALLLVAGAAHLVAGAACKLNAGGCCDFSGEWCLENPFPLPHIDGIMYKYIQPKGTCIVSHAPRIPGQLSMPCYMCCTPSDALFRKSSTELVRASTFYFKVFAEAGLNCLV